jgi:CheY-like chemotaxis protein
MKILIFDEDTESGIISEFCDRLKNIGEDAIQVSDWKDLEQRILEFKPDALLIDLMIPHLGLPQNECGDGYTTGAYIYRNKLRDLLPNAPFGVFTAADIKTTRIIKAIELLKQSPQYRGTFEKGEDAEVILGALTAQPRSEEAQTEKLP